MDEVTPTWSLLLLRGGARWRETDGARRDVGESPAFGKHVFKSKEPPKLRQTSFEDDTFSLEGGARGYCCCVSRRVVPSLLIIITRLTIT